MTHGMQPKSLPEEISALRKLTHGGHSRHDGGMSREVPPGRTPGGGWALTDAEAAEVIRASEREHAETVTFYLAVCHDCTPVLPQPFYDRGERDTWAVTHAGATDHKVTLMREDRVAR